MTADPFALPEGNVSISFSGGRSSAYMLHAIMEAHGGLPDRVRVVFANTGRERPETLDFVAEVDRRWGVGVTWVEFRREAPGFEVVGRQGASVSGEPFEALIAQRRFLPHVKARFCTQELKIRPMTRYLIAQGWRSWTAAIGIRADEPDRLPKAQDSAEQGCFPFAEQPKRKRTTRERWKVWHPLAAATVSKADVLAFWRRQPFDLRLRDGNCDGCFLKSEAKLARLCREEPERHAWWEAQEDAVAALTAGNATWSKRYSRRELRERLERAGPGAFSVEGFLCQADDGECVI